MNAATWAGAGIDFVSEFATAAEWFAEHVARVGMRSTVPGCPGWTVLDLVTHMGNEHAWAATVVETGRIATEMRDAPSSTRPRRVAEWYLGKAEDLYSVLRDAPPERECWNFAFGAGQVGFWSRRQTHETVMHGVDLSQSEGLEERVPAALAGDGVDETLGVFLHRMHRRGHAADLTAPVCLRATDVDRSWVVEPFPRSAIPAQASPSEGRRRAGGDPPPPRVVPGHRAGVDLVEAPAAVLLKVLWKRATPADPELRVHGDEARVQRFLRSRLTA